MIIPNYLSVPNLIFGKSYLVKNQNNFDKSFTDVNDKNVNPITCKEVENVFSKLNDGAPGLDMIKSLIC